MSRNLQRLRKQRMRVALRKSAPRSNHPRSGSSLMIVLVLMGMLALLGVLFYTFSAQERSNAEYYSEAAKDLGDPSLDADTLFDWALEQIIVGTDRRLTNSMLWGSRHSMLSNSLGFGLHKPGDLQPFNGEGLNLIFDRNGNIAVDQNRNGLADDGTGSEPDYRYLLDYVDTEAAPKQYDNGERQLTGPKYFPQTDVGYTYPDINNVFLTYVGKVRDENGVVHQVVKPAYMNPGLLRTPVGGVSTPLLFEDTNNNGVLDAGEDLNGNGYLDDWCLNSNFAARSMRAHPSHLFVPAGGLNGTSTRRYLTDSEAIALIGPTARGFPFHPMDTTYNTNSGGAGAVYMNGRMGPYSNISSTANSDDPVQFDYDNDGDGLREAVLMDLDFPAQQDALGKLFVPIYMITIHDFDGLINLNAHGNLAKVLYGPNDLALAKTSFSNSSGPLGMDSLGQFNFLSQSNLGLSPSEINPLWALNARVGIDNTSALSTIFNQHRQFYGSFPASPPVTTPSWLETANMEYSWAKVGRLGYSASGTGAIGDVTDLFPGVYGEEGNLYSALQNGNLTAAGGQALPRPGIPLQDDNNDLDEGQGTAPYFQHPMDFKGEGSYVSAADPKKINWSTQTGPNRWITYNHYGDNNSTAGSGNIRWGQSTSNLMTQPITQGLGDDPNEVASYADRRDIDSPFQSDENLFLNLWNTEIDRINVTSRLAKLLPFNFAKSTTDNQRGDAIRRKFTVDSNDRKSFGLPTSLRAMGTSGNGQEYSLDPNTGTHKFPPQFGTVNRYNYSALAEDPFRYATRTLLEIERVDQVGQQLSIRPQRKLSINHLLTGDANNPLEFRHLTPHPVDPGPGVVSSAPNVTNYPPTTDAGREYWARRDRQKMARDIYVMLYLLGHGDDTQNTATTSNANPSATTDGSTLYSEPQLREMAQFAVNLVDSMDRDNVITRFEYDKDLSDGWNLDDDPYGKIEATPYTSSDSHYISAYPNDSATRGEVFGVEQLDVTISESLLIQAKKGSPNGTNYSQTNFDESKSDRFFFYVEVLNHSPFPFSIPPKNAQSWQIVLRQEASGMNPAWERRLTFVDSSISLKNDGTVYVIGSTDAATPSSAFSRSTFAVDPAWNGTPTTWIAPNKAAGATVKECDLDLIEAPNPSSVFKIEDETGKDLTSTPGALLSAFTGPSPVASMTTPKAALKVQLRRRANATRASAAIEADNPWVEVDSMVLTDGLGFKVFDMGATPTASVAANQLKGIKSRERPQPLDGGASEAVSAGTGVATTLNTLGQTNTCAGVANPFTYWQLHFDRDYASVMDLLYVPVFGPHQLTALTKGAFIDSPYTQVLNPVQNGDWTVGPAPGVAYSIAAKSAAAKFMMPEDPSNIGNASPNYYKDNRWHRLLELLEVPTRTNVNLGVGTDMTIPRVPGRMNLNLIRHADNLAALLDDKRLMTLNLSSSASNDPEAPSLDDVTEGITRDWWHQFLLSRDLPDPYAKNNASISVPLPGLPGSKPFRNLADVGYSNPGSGLGKHSSVEDTILRSLPIDAASSQTKRRLFEIGTYSEHSGTNPVDPFIRNRLLSKIAGNTTTRSNCFGIFISVKYFQAVEQNGAIRIGGPLNGKPTPEHRGFFVVDRSKLENGMTSPAPTFDFRGFVNYRKTLQTQ